MDRYKYIPADLRSLKQWLLWKTIIHDGKPSKLPFSINGMPAKSNDITTWATFDEAVAATVEHDGIGFVFTADDPYCGIDFDSCRNPETGVIETWAKDEILKLAGYAEVSPSMTGAKVIVRAKWNATWHQHKIKGVEASSEKKPGIEIYDALRYFCITGIVLQGQTQVADRQEQVDALQAWIEAKEVAPPHPPRQDFRSASAVFQRARKYVAKIPGAVSGQNGHNATFHVACILVLGFGLSRDESLSAISEWNHGCQPPWSEKELIHKVESAQSATGERGYLRNVDPKNFDKVVPPSYKLPDAPYVPESTTLKAATLKYVKAVTEGIQKSIDTGLPELDYAIGGGVESGELVILAGRPSHGKSAIALQMIHHWTLQKLPCLMISEEMSAIALGKRVTQFATDLPQEHWEVRAVCLNDEVEKHFHDRAECRLIESCKTAEAVGAAIRSAVAEIGCKCVVVDYAQLLTSSGKGRYEQVTNTSMMLRHLATETGVVLLALCQLSRAIESRDKFIPRNSDLKETGQLEQDADVILFGVWPHKIDSDTNPNEYQIWVSKNRNRPINQNCVDIRFEPSRQRFLETKQRQASYSEARNDDF